LYVPNYNTWGQIAGYFDADGTIVFSDTTNQPYKLSLSLIFVDQSEDQIRNVKDFLRGNGIRTSNILKASKGGARMVAVSEFGAVKEMLGKMLPHLFKKSNEAHGALSYYEGRITGNELFSLFQNEVEAGRRERRERKVPIDVLYKYPEGARLLRELRKDKLRDAMGRYRAKVTPRDFENIREEWLRNKRPMMELAKMYPQYGRTTIRRVLSAGRGYGDVNGKGVVNTADANSDLSHPSESQGSETNSNLAPTA